MSYQGRCYLIGSETQLLLADTNGAADKKGLIELGLRQSDEMILTAARLLRGYVGRGLPRAAREVIALFAGQPALHDSQIATRVYRTSDGNSLFWAAIAANKGASQSTFIAHSLSCCTAHWTFAAAS